MAELIDIFADVKSMTPNINYMSALGEYIDPQDKQVAEAQRQRIAGYLPKESLAFKIVDEVNMLRITDKQRWVVAYQLQKNPKYIKWLDEFLEDVRRTVARKKEAKKRKNEEKKRVKKAVAETASANVKYAAGSKVEHPTFGKGTVISNDGNIIEVKFGKETKKLMAKYTRFKS